MSASKQIPTLTRSSIRCTVFQAFVSNQYGYKKQYVDLAIIFPENSISLALAREGSQLGALFAEQFF